MKARLLTLCGALFLAPLLMAASCEDPDTPPPDCDERVGADAKGRWTIHARGWRKGCEDETLNGRLTIDVRQFTVDGRPLASNDDNPSDTEFEADAFVERIRRSQYELVAGADKPTGLEFTGFLNTCQVTFTLTENLPRNTFHTYTFDGFVESTFRIYGEFDGSGPNGCSSSGTFEVELR
jgi:hypothetical protein